MANIKPRDRACYCIGVRMGANTLTKIYDEALKPVNISISQYSLLNDIKMLKTCNKSELAQYSKRERTTIIRNLKGLIEKKLIEEIPGPDNRNNLIQLTELGLSILKEGFVYWEQAQAKIVSELGLDDVNTLMNITKKLTNLTC
jgi:DNA-binding MarR family transcriptional regulator